MKKSFILIVAGLISLFCLPAFAENQSKHYSMWIANKTGCQLSVLNITGPITFEGASPSIGTPFMQEETFKLELNHQPVGGIWIDLGEDFRNAAEIAINTANIEGQENTLEIKNHGKFCAHKISEWRFANDVIFGVEIHKC